MADGCRHVADLALFAFSQHNAQPGGGDGRPVADGDAARRQVWLAAEQLDLCRGHRLPLHRHPRPQRDQRLGRGHVLHLYQISFGQFEAGMGQPVRKVTVVGQQQQPLAVLIQPAGGVDFPHGDVVGQGGTAFGVGEAAQDAVRLVKQQITPGGGDFPPIRGRPFRCGHFSSFRHTPLYHRLTGPGLDRDSKFS